jgi:DNA polymerase-4
MRTIFLLDIDCFFASVEMARHPELRGKPLCIGGRRGDRGIVACPNYEARAYGVKTAMPLRMADKLLPPNAVFMPGSHKLYGEYSERVMDLLYDFTPDIEQVSIDEAYLDVTGCLHFWGGDPIRMAQAIKDRVWKDCGLHTSVGIASNKVCANIGASLRKPDGLVFVPHGKEKEFLAPLPVEMIPGIGVKTTPKLHAQGIVTVADILGRRPAVSPRGTLLADMSRSWLGRYLTALANGHDDQIMHYNRIEKSISRDTTFWHDTADPGLTASTLYYLTERCCKTLRERGQRASTVTTKVRWADFSTFQKQTTLAQPAANEEEIFSAAHHLLRRLLPRPRPIRLVGVKVSHILPVAGTQLSIDATVEEKRSGLHQRLDALQEKYGYASIQWGITHSLHEKFDHDKEGYRLHSPVYEL